MGHDHDDWMNYESVSETQNQMNEKSNEIW